MFSSLPNFEKKKIDTVDHKILVETLHRTPIMWKTYYSLWFVATVIWKPHTICTPWIMRHADAITCHHSLQTTIYEKKRHFAHLQQKQNGNRQSPTTLHYFLRRFIAHLENPKLKACTLYGQCYTWSVVQLGGWHKRVRIPHDKSFCQVSPPEKSGMGSTTLWLVYWIKMA